MKQGQACDWMNLQARASDVNDTRCHDKVGVDRFQLPGQRTHPVGAEVLSIANSDHVRLSSAQRFYNVGLIAKDWYCMSVDIDECFPCRYPNQEHTPQRLDSPRLAPSRILVPWQQQRCANRPRARWR